MKNKTLYVIGNGYVDSSIMNGDRPSVMRFVFMFINILIKLEFLISIFIFENH